MTRHSSGPIRRTPFLLIAAWMMLSAGCGTDDDAGLESTADRQARQERRRKSRLESPRFHTFGSLNLWWDDIPQPLRQSVHWTGPDSNIHPDDYAGPESCRNCHRRNYDLWAAHPHRWMNALAEPDRVQGDFSESAGIDYLGGHAWFERDGDDFRMRLERGGRRFVYSINQTIGSRFFQYYVGKLESGPLDRDHPYFRDDHVLPFGYWLDRSEWVPVVHVMDELPDGQRADPFDPPSEPRYGTDYHSYSSSCSGCHSTYALGDNFLREAETLGRHAPQPLHWHVGSYLQAEHPAVWPDEAQHPADVRSGDAADIMTAHNELDAHHHGVTLGISCEACHLGCKQHALGKQKKPDFDVRSPLLYIETDGAAPESGRTQQNVNQICARCHAGSRPAYANGISTWNSTEFTDASRGSCYSQLRCIDCHNPHEATGPAWPHTADHDDAVCTKCHDEYQGDEAVAAHTHHPVGSSGSRCLNCHMPRLNEGLQDVVRTHTIFSPTDREMIESNQPNACNLCHVEQPIDWTLTHLGDWYGASYSEPKLARAYPHRDGPTATGWLKSDREAVRLVALDALTRANATSFLSEIVSALDDPYLLNRQFARIGIERMLDVRLEDHGYRFYMTPEERREPLDRIRAAVIDAEPKP